MFYYTGHSVQYNFINIIRHHTIKDHQTVFALIVYKKKPILVGTIQNFFNFGKKKSNNLFGKSFRALNHYRV